MIARDVVHVLSLLPRLELSKPFNKLILFNIQQRNLHKETVSLTITSGVTVSVTVRCYGKPGETIRWVPSFTLAFVYDRESM